VYPLPIGKEKGAYTTHKKKFSKNTISAIG
jgi:hypothetical protein